MSEAKSMVAKKVEESQGSRVPGALTLLSLVIIFVTIAFVVKELVLPVYMSDKANKKQPELTQIQMKEAKYMQ